MSILSIIIPVYNGSRTIRRLVDEIVGAKLSDELEIILVNDGSYDDSHEICLDLHKRYPNVVRYLQLAKNFGEHNSVLAGLNYANGDYAVIIDDDFQNPPQEIRKLLSRSMDGRYDVVYSYYDEKMHPWYRKAGSLFNNLVASWLLNKPIDLYLSSFKCINAFTIREIIKYKGPYPYIDGLILRTTRNIGRVLVSHRVRREGKSGYTFIKLVRLWLNMFVNFSVYPLRLSAVCGFLLFIMGSVFSLYLIVDKLINPGIPFGVTSILVAVVTLYGVQMVMLGLLGEYIGKQFLTDNQTPQYVVRNVFTDVKADNPEER